MTIIKNEDIAYAEFIKKTRYEGDIEDRQVAWDIACDMLWDAVHASNMTTHRAYDRLTTFIGKAFRIMQKYTAYYFAADDGEWLVLEW